MLRTVFANVLFVTILSMLYCSTSYCQKIGYRATAGSLYYLGDLAPYGNNLSTSSPKPAFGFNIIYGVAPQVNFSLGFLRGSIAGSDAEAADYNRRRRNLSFESPITEVSFTTQIVLTELHEFTSKWGVNLYIYSGFNIFYFNPRAYIDDKWVELQPLGTEGQGIVEFGGWPKYKRTQVGLPLGIGLDFSIGDRISFGFEVAPRLTFTDYLDDVSTDYPDYDRQVELQGELTACLANRIYEFEEIHNPQLLEANPDRTHFPGYVRGDPTDNDWYLYTNLMFAYRLVQKALNPAPSKITNKSF